MVVAPHMGPVVHLTVGAVAATEAVAMRIVVVRVSNSTERTM